MTKKLSPVFLLFLLSCLSINSCKTDFNIIAPYKPISVVYGLLDPAASVQYIKVNKAFEGEGNALVMAQQKDSINYAPGAITVQLQSVNPGQKSVTYTLDTTTTIPKDPGLFSNPYQLLYKTRPGQTIVQDGVTTYNLLITNNSDHTTLTSSTTIVDSINTNTLTPAPGDFINFTGLDGITTYTCQFQAAVNARVFTLVIRFNYTEVDLVKGDTTFKYVDWSQGNQKAAHLDGSDPIAFTFNKTAFYSFLASQLVASSNLERFVGGNPLDFMIYFGGDQLSTYIDVNQPSLGIVQDVPQYSNITGGIGIFSSRSSTNVFAAFDPISIDTLESGQYTRALNFH